MKERSFLGYFVLFLKGLTMGAANKIPGISGGMIALVGGFYEELMYTFQKINPKAIALIRKRRWQSFLNYINYKFLFIIILGMVTAFFTISLFIDWLINPIEEGGLGLKIEVWSFFFGLIIGSIYYIWMGIEKWKPSDYFFAFTGMLLGLTLSFIEPLLPNDNTFFVILCGFVSVSGMALPGFSGSFLLIILGNYNLILVDSVNSLFFTISALFSGDWQSLGTNTEQDYQERLNLLRIVSLFTISSIVGLISFSRLMNYLLQRFRNKIIAVLLGVITGSLGAAWPWKKEILDNSGRLTHYQRYLPKLDFNLSFSLVGILLGVFLMIYIFHYQKKLKTV